AILASTILCSLLYAQSDFDRMVLVKHNKMMDAFVGSAAFLLLCVGLFFAIPRWHVGFETTMLVLGLCPTVKIARLFHLIGKPDIFWGWRLARRDFRTYFFGSLLAVIGYMGYNQVPLLILGYTSEPIQAAAFVATRGLMQPLAVIIR